MSKWREVRLGEVAYKAQYGYTASAVIEDTGIKFLRITDIVDYFINWSTVPYCKINEKELDKYLLKKSDLIIARTGATAGSYKIIKEDLEQQAVFASYLIRFEIDSEKINPVFLSYYMATSFYKGFIENHIGGAAQPNINANTLSRFKVQIPDLETQEKIAHVLSTYDELIENNNRRIEILEKSAEEIYKEWFVRMRFPGYENTRFEKGIPEGWEVRKIGDLISFDIGGGWGKDKVEKDFNQKAYVIRGTDIPDMKYGKFNYEILRFHKESNLRNRRLVDGDIIFEASGGSKNQRLGRTFYITDSILKMYDEDVICASFCKLIRIENKYISWFINNYLQDAYSKEILSTFEVQSTGISNFGFNSFKKHHNILMPSEEIIKEFYDITYNMQNKIITLWQQNQNLAQQRDLLLPRLMNGTIQVK